MITILAKYPEIKDCLIFKDAEPENLEKYLCDGSYSEQSFFAGDEILSPSAESVAVGYIIEGKAAIISADGGKNVLLRTVGKGALFGVATLYSLDTPFPTRISAKSACRVLFIERNALKALIENDRAVNKAFLSFLGNRIVYLNKKINSFTAGNAERRLSLFLADNESDGVYSADISMSALADMLDIARASLYRAIDKLSAEGFIEKHDKTIILKDKTAMLEKYFG